MLKFRPIDEALDSAVRDNDQPLVAMLLEQGANPQADEGCASWITAFDAAAKLNHHVCLHMMAPFCNLERHGEQGWTALHWAAEFGAPDALAALIRAGASLHALDEEGWTPLMLALRSGAEDYRSHGPSSNGHSLCIHLLMPESDLAARYHTGESVLDLCLAEPSPLRDFALEVQSERERRHLDSATPTRDSFKNHLRI